MLSINWSDVVSVLQLLRPYLITFAVIAVVAVIVVVAVKKQEKMKKKLIRAQAGVVVLLAFTIIVNLICTGPMSTLLTLASGSEPLPKTRRRQRRNWEWRLPGKESYF